MCVFNNVEFRFFLVTLQVFVHKIPPFVSERPWRSCPILTNGDGPWGVHDVGGPLSASIAKHQLHQAPEQLRLENRPQGVFFFGCQMRVEQRFLELHRQNAMSRSFLIQELRGVSRHLGIGAHH